MKDLELFARIPIFDSTVYLVITDDIQETRKKKKWLSVFGVWEGSSCTDGLCSHNFDFNVFAIFLKKEHICHNVIGHEIYHVADRIFQCVGQHYDDRGNECFAMLSGWLHQWVYRFIKKNKIKINPKRLA